MDKTWIIIISIVLVPLVFHYLVRKPAAWIYRKLKGRVA